MDPAARRAQKEQLLRDVETWNGSDPRGFQDIVRNAVDIDLKYMRDLMKAFGVDRDEIRKWGSGKVVPDDFNRYAIVEQIREALEKDLNA
ncbi:MAG TPA: hypothetical protein VL283_01470 [Candidatus Baltobacteraceae bacterium]|nr:hypothetical protein [Candidatus Baltobacteraceae bacterium]